MACYGSGELELECHDFAFRGIPLHLGGVFPVPCIWCRPGDWRDAPWADALFKAVDSQIR